MISNSRFVCSINQVSSIDESKQFLRSVGLKMPDATHHAYAFRIGYGNNVIEGMSDDGEPAGTAGSPILTVIRGSEIGDIMVVVTRYFGGTKLGMGGLARAYTEAAKQTIGSLPTEYKIQRKAIGIELPYSFYKPVQRVLAGHDIIVEDVAFAEKVMIIVSIPLESAEIFVKRIRELSSGQVEPIPFD